MRVVVSMMATSTVDVETGMVGGSQPDVAILMTGCKSVLEEVKPP